MKQRKLVVRNNNVKLKAIPKHTKWWNMNPFEFLNDGGVYRRFKCREFELSENDRTEWTEEKYSKYNDKKLMNPLFRILFDFRRKCKFRQLRALLIISSISKFYPSWFDRNQVKYLFLLHNDYGRYLFNEFHNSQFGYDYNSLNDILKNIMVNIFPFHIDFLLNSISSVHEDKATIAQDCRKTHSKWLGETKLFDVVPRKRVIEMIRKWIQLNFEYGVHNIGEISDSLIMKLRIVELLPDLRRVYERNPCLTEDDNHKTRPGLSRHPGKGWRQHSFLHFDEVLSIMGQEMRPGDPCVRMCDHCDGKETLLNCISKMKKNNQKLTNKAILFINDIIENDYFGSSEFDEEDLLRKLDFLNEVIPAGGTQMYTSDAKRSSKEIHPLTRFKSTPRKILLLFRSCILQSLGRNREAIVDYLLIGSYHTNLIDKPKDKWDKRFFEVHESLKKKFSFCFEGIVPKGFVINPKSYQDKVKLIHKENPIKIVDRYFVNVGNRNFKTRVDFEYRKNLSGLVDFSKYNNSYLIGEKYLSFAYPSNCEIKDKTGKGQRIIIDIHEIINLEERRFGKTGCYNKLNDSILFEDFLLSPNIFGGSTKFPLLIYYRRGEKVGGDRQIYIYNPSKKTIIETIRVHDYGINCISICKNILISCSGSEVQVTDLINRHRSFSILGNEGCKKIIQRNPKCFFLFCVISSTNSSNFDCIKEINILDFEKEEYTTKVFLIPSRQRVQRYSKTQFFHYNKYFLVCSVFSHEPRNEKANYLEIHSRKSCELKIRYELTGDFVTTGNYHSLEHLVVVHKNLVFISGDRIIISYHLLTGKKLRYWKVKYCVMNLKLEKITDNELKLFFVGGEKLRKIRMKVLDFCWNCNSELKKGKLCSGCFRVKYCSHRCQKLHWKIHKKDCF